MPKNDHLWKKGQSGNPAGRPPKAKAWSELTNEILNSQECTVEITLPDGKHKQVVSTQKDVSLRYAIIAKQVSMALEGDMAAMRELATRSEGLPRQALEIAQEPKPSPFEGLSVDELKNLAVQLKAEA